VKKFNEKTTAIQGSGWGWLAYCPVTHGLSIQETANQDQVETKGLIPLLTVDVWEHAYYLQYKNLRPDYLTNIWKVINWRCVEDRFNKASNFQKL
jgi:Fe-Mn family superoxide dismutase